MKKLRIEVENLKFGVRETITRRGLIKLNAVQQVAVNAGSSEVTVLFSGNKEAKEKVIEKKLRQLRYPKKEAENHFQTAKSYISCAIGKVSDKATQ